MHNKKQNNNYSNNDINNEEPKKEYSDSEEECSDNYQNYKGKEIFDQLKSLEGNNYKAQKDLMQTSYTFDNFMIYLDYVQGDPQARPSKIRIVFNSFTFPYPKEYFNDQIRRISLADFLARKTAIIISDLKLDKSMGGGGQMGAKGGDLRIDLNQQEVLNRSNCIVHEDGRVEFRLSFNLPAKGRRIMGEYAASSLKNAVNTMETKLNQERWSENMRNSLKIHVTTVEDQHELRKQIKKLNWVSFIANDSILPRESGVSEKPLLTGIKFQSPKSLVQQISLKSGKTISGMAIPHGITVIVGGGFHGKSTLVNAISKCIYDHIPGDGREQCVTSQDCVKIRAEDGRHVSGNDISMFLNNLPQEQDTSNFSTENASGSTSQASNIIESLELGADCLVLDEDTCATNFMVRDTRMQFLVSKDMEPITPQIFRVKELAKQGVSTILVTGGCSDYLEHADVVIAMNSWIPYDQSEKARELIKKQPSNSNIDVVQMEINKKKGKRIPLFDGKLSGSKCKVLEINKFSVDYEQVDLTQCEQLVSRSQTQYIMDMIKYLDKSKDRKRGVSDIFNEQENKKDMIDQFNSSKNNDQALPRKQETAMALNRLRSLKFNIKQE